MYWSDEGYLLSKNNFDENSIIIESFTLNHGRFKGIVYGGASRKQKKNFQIGNKLFLNWRSKGENRPGYFNTELLKAISPKFFDDKKKTACILSATSILKILLPERQTNATIFKSFEKILGELTSDSWINSYIYWELFLIKELGYESIFYDLNSNDNKIKNSIIVNERFLKVPNFFHESKTYNHSNLEIKKALSFNKNLILENFIIPNRLKFPLFRKLLESYYN